MSFLGIDLGTSFIKGAVLNLATRQLEHIRRIPFPDPVATGDSLRCEYDPQQILNAVRSLISELAPHASDCQGVVMCAQMHGLVLMNDRGEAVSNCVTWRDQRALAPHPSGSGSYFDVIVGRTDPQMRRQVGNELEPARPVSFLFCFEQESNLGARPHSGFSSRLRLECAVQFRSRSRRHQRQCLRRLQSREVGLASRSHSQARTRSSQLARYSQAGRSRRPSESRCQFRALLRSCW